MTHTKICFIRHAESVANVMREHGEPGSQDVRDPPLSAKGLRDAKAYGSTMRTILEKNGFDLRTCQVASSPLQRARQTVGALFPSKQALVVPSFGENGVIPENTPAGRPYQAPNFTKTMQWIKRLGTDVVVVGHGSFLRQSLQQSQKVKNLDAFILEDDRLKSVPFSKMVKLGRSRKRSTIRRRRSQKQSRNQRTAKQYGGYPLAMYSPGAQMHGTSPTATGVGIGSSNDSWARNTIERT